MVSCLTPAQKEAWTTDVTIGRIPDWLAQWEEALLDREQKITRPRQLYVDEGPRHLA